MATGRESPRDHKNEAQESVKISWTSARCVFIPSYLSTLESAVDEQTRREMIKHIKNFQGEPMPPNDMFGVQWIPMESELQGLMDAGLVPSDSVASAGGFTIINK